MAPISKLRLTSEYRAVARFEDSDEGQEVFPAAKYDLAKVKQVAQHFDLKVKIVEEPTGKQAIVCKADFKFAEKIDHSLGALMEALAHSVQQRSEVEADLATSQLRKFRAEREVERLAKHADLAKASPEQRAELAQIDAELSTTWEPDPHGLRPVELRAARAAGLELAQRFEPAAKRARQEILAAEERKQNPDTLAKQQATLEIIARKVAEVEKLEAQVRDAVREGAMAYADVPALMQDDEVVVRYAVRHGSLAVADVPEKLKDHPYVVKAAKAAEADAAAKAAEKAKADEEAKVAKAAMEANAEAAEAAELRKLQEKQRELEAIKQEAMAFEEEVAETENDDEARASAAALSAEAEAENDAEAAVKAEPGPRKRRAPFQRA